MRFEYKNEIDKNNLLGFSDFHSYKMTDQQARAVEQVYLQAIKTPHNKYNRAKAVLLNKVVIEMEWLAKILILAAIALFSIKAAAKTNPEETLQQLKTNADNSEFNYKQYQDNLDVVNKNVEQSDKAVKELRALKQQLISNTKNVDKNKKSLADMQLEIQKMKAAEQAKMAQDDKQILEVKKILEKLEANKKKREENIASYDQMTTQVQQEIKEWDTQVQQMATLQKELDAKEKRAVDEKANWTSKRKDYEAEAKKWESQSKTSKATYDKYKKLND